MNLTLSQKFQITLCLLGVLLAGTGQLTILFGQTATSYIVSASGLLVAAVSGVGAIVTGQGSQIAAVQAMPGVEKIVVNKQANSTLATMAVDQSQLKIETLPQDQAKVEATAAAASCPSEGTVAGGTLGTPGTRLMPFVRREFAFQWRWIFASGVLRSWTRETWGRAPLTGSSVLSASS